MSDQNDTQGAETPDDGFHPGIPEEVINELAAATPGPAEQADAPVPNEPTPRPGVNVKGDEVFGAPIANNPFGVALSLCYAMGPWAMYEQTVTAAEDILSKKKQNPMHLEWAEAVDETRVVRPRRGLYERILEEPESDWAQRHKTLQGTWVASGRGRTNFTKSDDPTTRLSGIDALNRINDDLGLGTRMVIPLVHSGFTLSVYAPTDSELLLLEGQFGLDKVSMAQQTMGLTLSNTTAHHVHPILDFILAHVVDASIKDKSPDNLRRMIKTTDVQALLWGMAAAIYPNGFPYAQPCVHDLAKCDNVDEGTVNINKLLVINRRKFTSKQLEFLAGGREKRTNDEILEYQESCEINAERTFRLTDNMEVTMRVPNILEFQESGYRWVEELKTLVEKTFGNGISERTTDAMIMNHGQATISRQYGHFVKSIVINGQGTIEDSETLSRALGQISSNDESRLNFGKAVDSYIEGATASLVAIPAFNCKKCQKPPSRQYIEHPMLMPVDILQAFTVLLTRKLISIQARKQ